MGASLERAAPTSPGIRRAIVIEFAGPEPLLLWVPILTRLILSFGPSRSPRQSTWELKHAADLLGRIELFAAADEYIPSHDSIIVRMSPPGDWEMDLAGSTGLVASLRNAVEKDCLLHVSHVATVWRWLFATREAVLLKLAEMARVPEHARPQRQDSESFVTFFQRFFTAWRTTPKGKFIGAF